MTGGLEVTARNWRFSLLAVLLLLGPASALASTYSFTGTYGYYNLYPGPGPINNLQVYISGGPMTFADPGLFDYDHHFSGWTGKMINPRYATSATTSPDSTVGFDLAFASPGQPFTPNPNLTRKK